MINKTSESHGLVCTTSSETAYWPAWFTSCNGSSSLRQRESKWVPLRGSKDCWLRSCGFTYSKRGIETEWEEEKGRKGCSVSNVKGWRETEGRVEVESRDKDVMETEGGWKERERLRKHIHTHICPVNRWCYAYSNLIAGTLVYNLHCTACFKMLSSVSLYKHTDQCLNICMCIQTQSL